MANSGLGVPPSADGVGVTPLAHRKCIQGRWENPGIVYGLDVHGIGGLQYSVASGVAVCSRGSSDGYTEAYWAGGNTPAVSAGGSQPRIDAVWVKSNDLTQGDSSNEVEVGVTSGSASSNPSKPTVPAGCTVVAYVNVPVNMSATSQATVSEVGDYAQTRGAGGGRLAYAKVDSHYTVAEDKAWHEQVKTSFAVSTRRLVNIRWKAISSVGAGTGGEGANSRMGSYFIQIRLDGKIINDMQGSNSELVGQTYDEIMSTRCWETRTIDYDVEVEPGAHQVSVWAYGNSSYLTYPVTLYRRIIEVVDRGTVA